MFAMDTNGIAQFNEFVKEHPPVGADGLKLQTNYVFLNYDDKSLFSTKDRVARLVSEFNELSVREIEEERQYREQIAIRDSFNYFIQKKNWKAVHDNLITFRKTLELTQIHLSVIAIMLSNVGHGIIYIPTEIPTYSDEPVSSEPDHKKKK